MAEQEIRIIGRDDPVLEAIPALFEEMYDEMRTRGLLIGLSEGGAGKWLKGIRPTLGRTSCLVVAMKNLEATGFAHGALRITPEYLGGELTGMITHIYIKPGHRRKATGRGLLSGLEQWFRLKKATSIDLQVIPGNTAGQAFWQNAGYATELIQYRKFL